MAANDLARLRIILEAESSRLQQELEKTNKKLNSFGASADRVGRNIKLALGGILGGVGIAAVVRGFGGLVDKFDEVSKASQSLGIATENLSALSYAADLSGTSFESLSKGLQRLSNNARDASNGTGEAKDAFEELGVSVIDSTGNLKNSEVLLSDIAQQFQEMEDGTKKTAIALRIFGRAGAELIPFLNEGRSGIKELTDEARELGIVIGGDAAKAAEDFNDNMTRLGSLVSALGVSLVTDMVGPLANITEAMVKAAKEGGALSAAIAGIGQAIKELRGDTDDPLRRLDQLIERQKDEIEFTKKRIKLQEYAGNPSAHLIELLHEEENNLDILIGKYNTLSNAKGAAAAEQKDAQEAIRKAELENQKIFERSDELLKEQVKAQEAAKKAAQKAAQARKAADNRETDSAIADVEKQNDRIFARSEELAKEHQDRVRAVLEQNNPYQALAPQLDELDQLLAAGEISWEAYTNAVFNATDAVSGTFDETIDKTKDVNDAAADMGYAFQSAFEDAVLEGKGLQDILKGLLQDIEKVILRQTITAPLGTAVAGGAASLIPSLFAAAEGTDSAPGGLMLVGERGPEMALPPRIGRQLISEVGWKFAPVSAPKMPGQVAGIQWQSDMPRIPGIPGQVAGIDWKSDAFKPNEIEDQGASVKWRVASIDIPSPAAQTIPIGWRVAPMPSLGLPATHDTGFKFSNDRVQEVALPPLMVGGRTIQLKAPSFGSMAMPKLPNLPMLSALGDYKIVGKDGPEIVNLPRGSQVVPNHILKTGRIWDWLNIPHFASGTTFAPGGVSLVGESGSELVKLPGSKGSASGGTVVNVINNTNQTATVQRSNGSDGREMINVIIGEIDRRISAGGSTGRIIERKYGLRTNPIGRTSR